MKKNFFKTIGFMCIVLFAISSCEMFTTSLGIDFARDKAEQFNKASAQDLTELASDPKSLDPDTANAIMDALGDKIDELLDLPLDQKEAVLDLALGATIPISTITDIVDTIDLNDTENLTEEETDKLLDLVLDGINDLDTTAINALLNDPDTLTDAEPAKLATAAVAVIAQVAKDIGKEKLLGGTDINGDPIDPPDIDFTEPAADIVKDFLGPEPTADKYESVEEFKQAQELFAQAEEDLTSAVSVIKLLLDGTTTVPSDTDTNGDGEIDKTDTVTITKEPIDIADLELFPGVSLDTILGGLGNTTAPPQNPATT